MSLCVCQGMSVHTCVCSSGSVYVFPHDLCARIGDLCVCVCGGLCLLVCMHKVAMCVRVYVYVCGFMCVDRAIRGLNISKV